jgi:hypothetical protein
MSLATVTDVAEKKTSKSKPLADKGRKPMIVQLRGSEEFKGWVEKIADLDRSSIAVIVEKALIQFAKTIGCNDPAPRR